MLTEKDINIFTIVKDKNNISPLRQWCIDSWHKCMPEANIMIFDHNDMRNPNWKYYDVIKNDKLWNWYLLRPKNIDACNNDIDIIENKKLPDEHLTMAISTDSIRIRLLRAIPNALYMDSDAYLNITSKEFLELCNKYGDFILNSYCGDFKNKNLVFSISEGYFAGTKNVFLDNIIEYYDKLDINTFTGDVEINIAFILNTKYLKEYDDIGLISCNSHHVIHLCCSTLAYNKNHFLQKKNKKN